MNKEVFAQYFSNVFHMELSENIKLFVDDPTYQITKEDYAVFIHEYWHYLLNISTMVRIRDFSLHYQIFPIFSKTLLVECNGESDTSVLTQEDNELLSEIGELFFAYSDGGFVKSSKEMIDFRVISEILSEDLNLTLQGKKVPFKKGKVKVEVTTSQGLYEDYLYINNSFIDESIANSIECMISNSSKTNPVLPYYILAKISEFFNNGTALNNYEIACIGTLSLLTTNSALTLNGLFKDYIHLKKKHTIDDSIKILCDCLKPKVKNTFSLIIADIDEILRVYENRAPVYQAIELIKSKVEMALSLRNNDLLFELVPFRNNVIDTESLENLVFQIIKPCPVTQKKDGDLSHIKRDEFRLFENYTIMIDGQSVPSSFLMQVINCQLNYFKAHWAIFTLLDSRLAEETCPYFTVCDLECRVVTPDICLKKPWKTFIRNGEKCAYSHAVSTLIAHTRLKP